MAHRAVLIPGDGIGPDVTDAAVAVVAAAGAEIHWDVHDVGLPAVAAGRSSLPAETVEAIRAAGVALKGPVSTPLDGSFRSVNLRLRQDLGLFLQVRPCRSWPGVPGRWSNIDLVVAREATEDTYAGIEFAAESADAVELVRWLVARGARIDADAAITIKPTSRAATARAAGALYRWANDHGRERVTIGHKASALPCTDGLFRQVAMAMAEPGLVVDDRAIDLLAADLVRDPDLVDVLFLPNQYGDIISDLAAALVGSVGLVPGVNIGDDVAVFEPAHGTAPRHAGANRANPTAMILSAAMLVAHLGDTVAGERIVHAVAGVLADGSAVTYDLWRDRPGDPATTGEMTAAVLRALSRDR